VRFNGQEATLAIFPIFLFVATFIIALFVAYTLFHYVLFLLISRPKDASGIGHELNQFEQRVLKPGGRLLIRSPGSLDHCRRKEDYLSVTAFFENWRYNFVGANLLVYKMRRLGFTRIHYRRLPFWAWGLTWNFIQHLLLWKYRLKMRTFVDLEKIIWRTSKVFVFGNLQYGAGHQAEDGV
jgi:hypothetical protein